MQPVTPRILVIDDATVIRHYYRHLLEAAGFAVDEAINGIESLEKLFTQPYGLCIVDVNMPLMDGFAFLQQARRALGMNKTRASLPPMLVTTTQEAPEDRILAQAYGAAAFLRKPVPSAELLRVAAGLLAAANPKAFLLGAHSVLPS